MSVDDDTRYRVMRLLESRPDITQRDLAREMGMSLGKANYCLQALIRSGWIKAKPFKNARAKSAYTYALTRLGRAVKSRLTVRFVASKMREYEGLLVDIDRMRRGTPRRLKRLARTS
jgi:MarR family transcriptional regulator, temperature-dependent positive regulator of motility